MKTNLLSRWLKNKSAKETVMNPNANANQTIPTLWLKNRPASSLLSQEIAQHRLRDRMEIAERKLRACPIAPIQEQMQTVWFSLVHEYLKAKRERKNHDKSREVA